MTTNSHTKKYRPVLTPAQISHILTLCKTNLSQDSISVISVLSVFEHKIANRVVAPAYVASNKIDAYTAFTTTTTTTANKSIDYIKQLYEAWLENPAQLSVTDLELITEYRYTNHLMSDTEKSAYETNLLTGTK